MSRREVVWRLPQPLLASLPPELCVCVPRGVLRCVCPGIQTEAVWRLHLSRRWNRSLQSSVFVFGREDDWLTEGPKQQYMQRHFHALLQSVFHQINGTFIAATSWPWPILSWPIRFTSCHFSFYSYFYAVEVVIKKCQSSVIICIPLDSHGHLHYHLKLCLKYNFDNLFRRKVYFKKRI